MRKLIVCAVMVGAMSVLTSGVPTAALAQGKKDKDSKKAGKGAAAAGVIEIGEGKDGKYRFFVRNEDGKLLAMSSPGGFATEKDAKEAIDELKEVVAKAKVTRQAKKDKDKDK